MGITGLRRAIQDNGGTLPGSPYPPPKVEPIENKLVKSPLDYALGEFGVKEINEPNKHNPRIVQYSQEAGFNIIEDETAWCSIFVNWCAFKSGKAKSDKANARSWLNVGEKIEKPELGCIVIFWREGIESWKGHVGFYISENDGHIFCLGGNQNNQVNIKAYGKHKVLGYRRINKTI